MNDDEDKSVDDALEETRADDQMAVGNNPLPEDNDSPASPPDKAAQTTPLDHPLTDSEVDRTELNDEGLDDAVNDNPTAEDETDLDEESEQPPVVS